MSQHSLCSAVQADVHHADGGGKLHTGLAVRKDGSKGIPEWVCEMFPVHKEMSNHRRGALYGV